MKIYKSDIEIPVPRLDLLTYLFDSPYGGFATAPDDLVLHVEAANLENKVTKRRFVPYLTQFAHGLRGNYGVGANGPGKDVVVLFSSGQPLVSCLFYGIIAAGGVVSTASHLLTVAELARQVKQGHSRLLACSHDLKATAVAAAKQIGLSLDRVLVLSSEPMHWSLKSVEGGINCWSDQRLSWVRITKYEELKESLIMLVYSSGTTGDPKGVMLSHLSMVTAVAVPAIRTAMWMAAQDPPPPKVPFRTLAHLPVAHISGIVNYHIMPVLRGGTCFWMRTYAWQEFIENVKKHRITFLYTGASVWLRISKSPEVTDHFKSVVGALSGASRMDQKLQRAAMRKIGDGSNTFIGQSWGMTETCGPVTNALAGWKDDTGSIGQIQPNMELRLVDSDHQDVLGDGQPGQLIVRGDLVTQGYYNNPGATRALFRNGWLYSGDIAIIRNNKFYIVDRVKDVIKYKGQQIAPSEIEQVLSNHPKIEEAAVVGVPADLEGSEVPRAFVVADPAQISVEEIARYVAQNLAPYKQLRGGVQYVTEIPKSTGGKMLKRLLRDQAIQETKRGSNL